VPKAYQQQRLKNGALPCSDTLKARFFYPIQSTRVEK
jgi:hypothetical protein